jgi:hypothetical protein
MQNRLIHLALTRHSAAWPPKLDSQTHRSRRSTVPEAQPHRQNVEYHWAGALLGFVVMQNGTLAAYPANACSLRAHDLKRALALSF